MEDLAYAGGAGVQVRISYFVVETVSMLRCIVGSVWF
jgi:hypothetical protein